MKKIMVSLLICLLFITGCSKTSVMTCKDSSKIDENTSIEVEYRIIYKGKYVKKLNSYEKINSNDRKLLEEYKTDLEKYYKDYNDIDYYLNVISIEDNTLMSSTMINYDKIDYDKLLKIDKKNKLIKDKKVKLSTLKEQYIKNGATCQ